MTCQHPACSFDIFASCTNHCTQNVCLEHLIEHGDMFLRDFTDTLDHLDKSTCILMKEANIAATQLIQRRQYEIERINRMYDEEQQGIRQRLALAEAANALLLDKRHKLTNSNQENECLIAQHDFEQIKLYTIQINKCFFEQKVKAEQPPATNSETSDFMKTNLSNNYTCPLIRPNVFGIKPEHNVRLDCNGAIGNKGTLAKHLEYYHRMLPECAIRLRDAVIDGKSPDQTELFSHDEMILNQEYLVDCPLTDSTNVFGARSALSTVLHLPCRKKQLTVPAMLTHFQFYHKMKWHTAKKLFTALKNRSLTSDLILFEQDERIGTNLRKNIKINE